MTVRLINVDPDDYRAHPIHGDGRIWPETNCYVDLWVEVLHSLGMDPLPVLAPALAADFDGRQWKFLKVQPEDLFDLYGIEVGEMNVWKPVLEHISDNCEAGILSTVEVDGYWLPDTSGTSYRREHTKTTVVPNYVDTGRRVLEYFHNGGYYRLVDADFDGLFGAFSRAMPPYVEQVFLGRGKPGANYDVGIALAHKYLERRPKENPVAEMGAFVIDQIPWLASEGIDVFHDWSFGTLRQCGATAEIAADFMRYLDARGVSDADHAARAFDSVAGALKAIQFQVARAANGRGASSLPDAFDHAAQAWSAAFFHTTCALSLI
ncbi:DUF1839 family protein [Skermania sp. ID1734]|uniref:DUF1839 family protein n=1 Tax=Skermania sp. ID1734 TaxID=2597516 RepID=UPI00117CFA76|nr:DUF1839 family protein [Skermania sp. ID1734]TSE00389.1 DUF1839 family protein [Skermania sp. ID1734]